MIQRIDHLGIAVRSIDQALGFYRDALGLTVDHIETIEEQKVKAAMLPVGESRLELMEPTDPAGAVGKFLETRGEGLQHVAIGVDDLEAALAQARERGARLIDEKPRVGAGGALVAFIHPKSSFGVLIELVQRGKGSVAHG
ncbi:MAG: methylmalonyl-CoA epimerase [Bacillota bacterium]